MTLPQLWYALVVFLLVGYVVLDGFDLGVGLLYFVLGKSARERGAMLRSVGPVWDGNEVWLIAAGGTLVLAFPTLYAKSFSGFYLPLMIVLWLLTFRALGVELRHQLHHPLWLSAWDFAFSAASILLIVMFGAALGNVVRGVTFDTNGDFFAPLWTNFGVDPKPGILDWYTVWVAGQALGSLALHGALWLRYQRIAQLAEALAPLIVRLCWLVAAQSLVTTVLTFWVQPQALHNVALHPLGLFGPVLAGTGLAGIALFTRTGAAGRAFVSSCVYLGGMLASAAFAIFPFVLPGRGGSGGLQLDEVCASAYSLRVGLYWWIPGMLLTLVYFWLNYRTLVPGTAPKPDGDAD